MGERNWVRGCETGSGESTNEPTCSVKEEELNE